MRVNNGTCSICQEKCRGVVTEPSTLEDPRIEEGSRRAVGLACEHVFHGGCLRGWIAGDDPHDTCPLCRRQIEWIQLPEEQEIQAWHEERDIAEPIANLIEQAVPDEEENRPQTIATTISAIISHLFGVSPDHGLYSISTADHPNATRVVLEFANPREPEEALSDLQDLRLREGLGLDWAEADDGDDEGGAVRLIDQIDAQLATEAEDEDAADQAPPLSP